MNNNKNREVINEHSGLLLNRDQRPVGGRLEYVDLNTTKNDGKIKPPRYTKVGNFVLHHHVAKEDLLGAKKSERSASQSEMNNATRRSGYPAMMKASAVVVMSLCFFLVVAVGGTKYVLRSSSNNALNANTNGESSWTRSASVPSSSSRSASSFSPSYSSSKNNKNMNALIGLREEPFIDANEKSIASEGVSLDGWFHISASLFVPSSMESSGGSGSSSSSSSSSRVVVVTRTIKKRTCFHRRCRNRTRTLDGARRANWAPNSSRKKARASPERRLPRTDERSLPIAT